MKKLIFFIFFIFVFNFSYASEFPLDPKIKYGKLENGLTYYIRKNDTPKKKVYLKLVVKAGSLMEEERQRGLAHLLEHMAFNGSKNFPGNSIDEFLSSLGLNIGSHFNATTGYFKTNYQFEIPTDDITNVEKGIQILSDIAGNLDLKDDQFEKERKIVEEEWRQDLGSENKYVNELLNYIYKDSLLLERRPIGTIDVIKNFRYQDVIDFYEKWYQPQIMAVFAIGDIDEIEIENFIKKHFNYLENTTELILPDPSIPNFNRQFFSYQNKKEEDIDFVIWNKDTFKPLNTFKNYKLSRIKNITENIFQKRIVKLINENSVNFKSTYIGDFNISDKDKYFIINTSLRSDKIKEGIEDIYYLIEQVKEHGFLQSELDKAKKEIIQSLEKFLTSEETRSSSSFVNEYIRHFTEDEMISGPEKYIEYSKKILPTISLSEVNNYFENYIKNENQILQIKGPSSVKNLPDVNEINKIKKIVISNKIEKYDYELKKVELIKGNLEGSKIIKTKFYPNSNVKEITLSNGAKILLKKTDFKKDQILIEGYSLGGYSTVDIDKLPSATYAESILARADVGDLTAPEKEELFPTNIIDIYPEISRYTESINGYSNNQYLEDLFKLLYVNFNDLKIQQHHIEIFKNEKIDELQIEMQNPMYSYLKDFYNKFYLKNPRIAYPTIEEYKKVNFKDVDNFYKERFQNSGDFTFVIVGDFKFDEIELLIKKYIGSLKLNNKEDTYIERNILTNLNKEKILYEEENPVKASVTRFYNKKFNNIFPNRLKNKLLISIIDKLIFDEIREKDKLVYSAGSYEFFSQKKPIGLTSIMINFNSDPKNIDNINKKIDEILANVSKKNFDKQIFINQKKSLIKDYEESLNSNIFWLNAIIKAEKYNESFERVNFYEQIINQITLNEISKLAKRYFDENYFETTQLIEQ